MVMELGELQKKWIKSLKENGHRQTTSCLGYIINSETKEYKACCLGEALVIINNNDINKITLKVQNIENLLDLEPYITIDTNNFISITDTKASTKYLVNYEEIGLYHESGKYINKPIVINLNQFESLASANDDENISWQDIAEYIEQNPENIFVESK